MSEPGKPRTSGWGAVTPEQLERIFCTYSRPWRAGLSRRPNSRRNWALRDRWRCLLCRVLGWLGGLKRLGSSIVQ